MSANLENPKEGARDLRCRVLVAGVGGGACSVLGHALAGIGLTTVKTDQSLAFGHFLAQTRLHIGNAAQHLRGQYRF